MAPGQERTGKLHIGFDDAHVVTIPFSIRVVAPLAVAVTLDGNALAGEDSVLRLTLTNHQLRPLATGTRVLVAAPADWTLWPGREMVFSAIAAGQSATRLIRCTLPPGAQAGATALHAYIIGAAASTTLQVSPPRPQTSAAHFTPTVDGDLSEWSALPPMTVGPGAAANYKDYGGEADLSARLWLAADDANLYVAADVTDDVQVQGGRDANIWSGDCIQLDLRPGRPPARSTMDRTLELGLALTPAGPELWQWTPEPRVVPRGRITILRTPEGHTLYEAAVPWSALPGIAHTTGSVAAMSFTVNESDATAFDGWLEWTPGICGAKDASRFGVARF
jgi:hypothetical protein